MNKKSFTLIEILVVVTIIALITSAAAVTYTQLGKQSRDSKRKADIEQIRAALEMYRSTNSQYPAGTWSALSILTGTPKYIQSLPTDPKSGYIYYYSSSTGTTYTVGVYLETGSGSCAAGGCGSGINCNYCLTPYGK